MSGVEIAPVCPYCGDAWSMFVPHGKRTVRIPCRRCGRQSDHTVATVMTDEGWLSVLAERERDRARMIRGTRITLWCNALMGLVCIVAAIMTGSWVPVSGLWMNLFAFAFGRSVLQTIRKER